MKVFVKFICLSLIMIVPSISSAGIRCENGKLVQKGDSKTEIKIKCGQPIDTEYVGVVKIGRAYVHVDRWIYYQGKGKFLKLLDFHGGMLAIIKNGSRM